MFPRKLFTALPFILFFVASTAKADTEKAPGTDFPDDLSIFFHFNKTAVNQLAIELVASYNPKIIYNEENEAEEPSVCYNADYCSTFDVMRSVRKAVYPSRDMYELEKIHKPAFLAAIKIASAYPDAVRWFYEQNADNVLKEMVSYASKPIGDDPEYPMSGDRPAYTKQQIAEMLDLYADLADRTVVYMRLALKTQMPEVEEGFKIMSEKFSSRIMSRQWHWERQEKAEEKMLKLLRTTTGMPFERHDFGTWKFAMRRMQNGGPELLKVLIDITKDASKRARAKAAELRK